MIRQPISTYVWFGTCLRFLQDARAGYQIGTPAGASVLGNLAKLLRELDALGLRVTANTAAKSALDLLRKKLHARSDATAVLTPDEAKNLQRLVSELRLTLDAELTGLHAFVVTPKRLDAQKLLGRVESLFSPDTYPKLADVAKYDLTESGKCIAFERPTAAAFHLLRGSESVLRSLYGHLVRRNRINEPWMWGAVVFDLRKRRVGATHKVLLDQLDSIRHNFRNPTQHPEKVYDMDEAQNLWGVCVDAIDRMAKLLPDLEIPGPWEDD